MAHRLSRPLAALFLACLAPGWTHAAELGEPRVSSFIGQQLVADIELGALEDPASAVGVKLASQDVYRGASIAMPPVLASLNMTVMRRDGRQFLHLTSLRPVDADHLHLFLELNDGGKRSVRLATLWLSADPDPAPVPVAMPIAAPAAAPVVASAKAAPAASAPKAMARQIPAPAAPKAQPPVKAAAARAPVAVEPAPHPTPQPPAASPVHRALPSPAPLPVRQPVPPAACVQQQLPTQASACLALDGKNAALRAEIGHLETQVKALQAALHATPAVVPKPQPAVAPKPQPAAPRKRVTKKAPPERMPAWIWVAGGAAVLAGAGAVFAVRRKRAGTGQAKKQKKGAKPEMEIVVTPRVMGDVRSRLMTEGPPSPMSVEPKL